MSLQTKIEQTAKEYLEYKSLYEERLKTVKEKETNIAKSIGSQTKEQLYGLMFDEVGSVGLMGADMNNMRLKLYHYLMLSEDLVEIPQNIKDLVENFKPSFTFTTGGEIVDKEMYNKHKNDFVTYYLQHEDRFKNFSNQNE